MASPSSLEAKSNETIVRVVRIQFPTVPYEKQRNLFAKIPSEQSNKAQNDKNK